MAAAIAAIASHQPGSRTYQLMTAVVYYAGLRPSEVVMLRPRALVLPASGWGRIEVVEADVSFDEPGEPKTGPRSVPIPPVLVEQLGGWAAAHNLGPDDLLFRTRNGRLPQPSNWSRAWQRALRQIDHPPLRVYDCRHAAATTWLKAGVPLGETARRLGSRVRRAPHRDDDAPRKLRPGRRRLGPGGRLSDPADLTRRRRRRRRRRRSSGTWATARA